MNICCDEVYLGIIELYPSSEIDALDSISDKNEKIFKKELKKELKKECKSDYKTMSMLYKEFKKGTSKCVSTGFKNPKEYEHIHIATKSCGFGFEVLSSAQ